MFFIFLWSNTYDEYACFIIAYAYVCTIIVWLNISTYLQAL